jgi:hypothetical protein
MGRVRTRKTPADRKPLLLGLSIGALTLVLVLMLAGCGGGSTTTTTPSTQAQPETTTTASIEETTTTEAVAETTTTTTEAVTTTTEAPTTTTSKSTTTTTEKLAAEETRLANGHVKAMGFIKKVWEQDGKRYIIIDYAEMLTGQEAIDAAIAAGDIQPGEDLPNDYYIRNADSEKRMLQVSDSVDITTSTWHGEMDSPVTWDVFQSFWSANPPDQEAAFLRDSPWWIERDGAVVVKIDEQYLP